MAIDDNAVNKINLTDFKYPDDNKDRLYLLQRTDKYAKIDWEQNFAIVLNVNNSESLAQLYLKHLINDAENYGEPITIDDVVITFIGFASETIDKNNLVIADNNGA